MFMNEKQAKMIGDALGGQSWQSGGDIWLVIIRRNDGHLVVISDDVICEYENEESFEDSKANMSILLS